ncbi:HAD family hydrolase [Ornithinibacillus californiensis]|uniref:HAD family hydrolase n=1 Tax=Ornithinibacillus californiensis TaxID=161536 RepID=UPI00064DE7D8|nr:HAD family hydrolase [Ornithinibacillus californiensis]
MKRKWITFDLDGTLMQNPFGEWVFPEIERVFAESVNNQRIFPALVEEHRNRMASGNIVEAYDWDDIVREAFTRYGVSVQVDVAKLVRQHSVPPKVYLLEADVIDAMLVLRNSGYAIATVTNGFEKYQKPVMDVLGLTDLFDTIITPEKVGYGKPRVEMVDSLSDTDNEIIAHVGDRLDHDVWLANELGVLSILFYQDMPESVKAKSPLERVGECEKWFHEKWRRETGNEEFPEKATPTMVIHSIKEIYREPLKLT